ncbi:TPA: hypothetical protein N0F65_002611 [Lagenidium giganteum]|uniref:Uncharacterized protein n=1 Tax=Lagenidium giganteum TaxID=4803 RepID=A0AAV2Z063_9STRA|nr:TPA: hypothetical protein N0F65_002611 [Lagenidium giganteum]
MFIYYDAYSAYLNTTCSPMEFSNHSSPPNCHQIMKM